jgi:DMSO reductase anchor subunit
VKKTPVLIEPVWQTIWQWPAVINLICGGMACGYYLINTVIANGAAWALPGSPLGQAADLVPPLLVLIGFSAVAVEAGRPAGTLYLLHHLRTSWMSREVLAGSFFILFSILDAFFHRPALEIPAILAATGLLFSQAMMVFRCRAVIAWNRLIGMLHFIAGGVYLGFGLLLILHAMGAIALRQANLWIGLLASIASLIAWQRFVFSTNTRSQQMALAPLTEALPLTLTVGLGHLIPLAIISIMILAGALGFGIDAPKAIYGMTGILVAIGSSTQKYYIILQSNTLREVRAEYCPPSPAS